MFLCYVLPAQYILFLSGSQRYFKRDVPVFSKKILEKKACNNFFSVHGRSMSMVNCP
jgi:hypothetical protein